MLRAHVKVVTENVLRRLAAGLFGQFGDVVGNGRGGEGERRGGRVCEGEVFEIMPKTMAGHVVRVIRGVR